MAQRDLQFYLTFVHKLEEWAKTTNFVHSIFPPKCSNDNWIGLFRVCTHAECQIALKESAMCSLETDNKADEMIGQPLSILMPDDHSEDMAKILGQIRRRERVGHFETGRRRKDGTIIDVSISVFVAY